MTSTGCWHRASTACHLLGAGADRPRIIVRYAGSSWMLSFGKKEAPLYLGRYLGGRIYGAVPLFADPRTRLCGMEKVEAGRSRRQTVSAAFPLPILIPRCPYWAGVVLCQAEHREQELCGSQDCKSRHGLGLTLPARYWRKRACSLHVSEAAHMDGRLISIARPA